MKSNKYLPLVVMDNFTDEMDLGFLLARQGYDLTGVTNPDLIRYISQDQYPDTEFGNALRNLVQRSIDRVAAKNKELGIEVSAETETIDNYLMGITCRIWSQNKQVYKIDRAFFEELARTEALTISKSAFRYLPYSDIYIDLSDIPDADPFAGAFVHVIDMPEGCQIVVYLVTSDRTLFSYYSYFRYDSDGCCKTDKALVPDQPMRAYNLGVGMPEAINYTADPRKEILTVILQLLMFLSCENTDIQESPVTKHTYRPAAAVRNRFSEVRMWDVGVRYAKAISFAKSAAAGKAKEDVQPETVQTSSRKMPRPHIRCAHWQRYHVGKGRTEVKVNWIPPVVVCGNASIPVTITPISA